MHLSQYIIIKQKMISISTKYLCTRTSSTTFSLQTFIHLLLVLVLLLCSTSQIVLSKPSREALQIIIGGGGGGGGGEDDSPPPETSSNCPPPPPPPPCPPPPSPPPCPPPTPSPLLPPPPRVLPPTPRPQMLSRIERARNVILEFKKRVMLDPTGITHTWQPSRNVCDYTGFKCVFLHEFTEVGLYAVRFNGLNFDGTNLGIDGLIDKLPDVSIFHANSNNFKGSIPDLSKLDRLFELDLSNNKYVGEFPRNVLSGYNLVYLDLRFNSLSGRVPAEIFNLKNLVVLFVNNNNFEQEIPSNFGSTPAAFITLDNNKFIGQIPKSIGNTADTLYEVLFLNNNLVGCLPYEVGLLKKARLFDVSLNRLTGPIPQSFACLAEMQYLVLSNNQFYGPVPELVCKLPLLKNFTLCNNYFTQVGPECMKLIRSKILDVRNNCILGLPDQRSPQECDKFFNQPKYCPDSIMYNHIPCKGKAAYLESNMALGRVTQLEPTISYHALSPKTN